MNPKKRVIAQIRHKETDFIPHTLYFEEDFQQGLRGTLENVNSYYGNDSWRAKLGNHIPQIPTVNSGVDLAPGMSLCTDMYGTTWRVDKRPFHLEKPALPEADLAGYTFPGIEEFFPEGWDEHLLRSAGERKNDFLVTYFGFGLFERTWTIRGFENALIDSAANPIFYQELIERIFENQMMVLEKLLALPLDGILFGDDYADQRGIIIGADRWRKYFRPYLAKLFDKVHQAGKYTMCHMCGSEAEILPDLIDIGLDVYESVQPEGIDNSPYRLKRLYGKDITFWGGLGSQSTVSLGTPNEIKTEVRKLCREMGKDGGYILSCSKPIQPGTPTRNAVAVIEAFAEQAGLSI